MTYKPEYIILIILSLIIMIGCDDEPEENCGFIFCDPETNSPVFPFGKEKDCNIDEYVCAGECTPVDIDCCVDHFGDEVGSCSPELPVCCPSVYCSTDLDSCPDVEFCPEHRPQPCGAFCIEANEECMYE